MSIAKLRTVATLVACGAFAAVLALASPAMAAPVVNIANGLFDNSSALAWSSAPSTAKGNRTVTRTTAGIVASGPTGTVFHQTLGTSRYMFIGGNNHLLILEQSTGAGAVQRWVSMVDFTTTPPTERPVINVLTRTNASLPGVQFSAGTGDAFLVFASTGTNVAGLGIYRSDTGTLLCAGSAPVVPTAQLFGEATATQLRIKMGGTVLAACTRPAGTTG